MLRRLRSLLADSGPVVVLAGIAAVGSFDHISKLAAKNGQKDWRSWAVAVCIDLMCVMAAREIQRDKRTGRRRRGLLSWPSLVLAGGIVLTLAANLAEADHSMWGWILAATPAGAFLIAMSMLERRAAHTPEPPPVVDAELVADQPPNTAIADERPELPSLHEPQELDSAPLAPDLPAISPVVLDDARYFATEYARLHGIPIPADELIRRMRITPDLAHELLRRLAPVTETA
ncbi:DUF2637 domain-containing protein [Planotetraspora sp. A-T 1434]|uniref:DUF2637 domain-containing protein n=1 Tax=Planotetraspora sp. A-T 1434 TaxID=2979219 RepID=UPI0028FC11E9|nr:DUF2637 domain-containing protein [Planotetraspora sp. A-T 1434]